MKAFQSVCWSLHRVPSQWPVSMTTPPSIHLRVLAAKWEKSPEPEIPLTRSTPRRWETTETSCTLSKVWSEKSSIFALKVRWNDTERSSAGLHASFSSVMLDVNYVKLQLKTGWILYEKQNVIVHIFAQLLFQSHSQWLICISRLEYSLIIFSELSQMAEMGQS